MIGIKDPWVSLVYVLCILSSLLCVVWGAFKWNEEAPEEPEDEVRHWAEEEDKVEEEL